ncbi:MAG: preprotein translocase subunit YajC [Actinomycetota bacterium]
MNPTLLLSTSAPPTNNPLSSFLFLGLMLGVFYFLLIRPQRRRARAQQQLVSELQLGDRVQSIGGIQGIIKALDEDSVLIEVEQGRIRLARRAIASKIEPKA